MKTELELVRVQHVSLGLPLRDKPEKRVEQSELMARRRLIRVETEDFLNGGLWADDFVELAIRTGRVAFVVAGACAQFGIDPDIRDFADAVTAMIRDVRAELDAALRVCDWPAVRTAAVKMEVIWYGVAANLGLPYHDLLNMLHGKYVNGLDVDKDEVRALLHRAGLPVGAPPNAIQPTE